MSSATSRHPRVVALLVLTMTIALLPFAGVGAQDLEEVQAERAALEDDLESTQLELEEAETAVIQRQQELEALTKRQEELEDELSSTREALTVRARSAFKRGSDMGALQGLLSADGPQAALDRASSLEALARRDNASIESAESLDAQLEQTTKLRAEALAGLEELQAQLEEKAAEVSAELEAAKALEADVKQRDARKKRIQRGAQNGTYACMMARPYSFIDSWGFPRSGGRSHKGTDVMAPHGTEVYAFTDGYISRMKNNRLGGIVLYLQGDDGAYYYYAHLQGYASTAYVGKRVEAGELIAYNGNTGNARGGAPHVHFEVHPGGGGAVNPYPWLRAVCPR